MSINELKQEVGALQSQGKLNDAFSLMYSTWDLDKRDSAVATLFISECYWFLQERDFYKDNPQAKVKGYDEIDWGFEAFMQKALLYGLHHYENDPEFLWRIGRLFCIDFIPFLFLCPYGIKVSEFGDELIAQAERISPDNILIQLVSEENRVWNTDMIKRASEAISSYKYENFSDQELRIILGKMLDSRIYALSRTDSIE